MSGTFPTSPAATYSTAALVDAERVDCRRFAGYPPYGGISSGFQSWRFFQVYGLLEYRMSNFDPNENANIRYYLAQLYTLETALFGASSNLDTDQAAVWKHNRAEVRDRTALLTQTRRELATLIGVPPGPLLADRGLRFVV